MKNNKGFIAFTSILIISAVVLSLTVSTSLLGIGEGQAGLATFKGEKTLYRVEGCMEDVLLAFVKNKTYMGGVVVLPEGVCEVTVSRTGNSWTFVATNTESDYKRKITVVVDKSGNSYILTRWQET